MDGMLALTIVCVVFAIGDFISDKTHAIIPVLLFASVTFLILFWTGVVPTTLFTDAGLIAISNMMTGIFIVNMGTLLDFKEFVSQWKTVVLGLAIVIVGGILMFFAARPVLGNNFAVALVGPITGGWVSAVVVNDAIKALGSPDSPQARRCSGHDHCRGAGHHRLPSRRCVPARRGQAPRQGLQRRYREVDAHRF